MRRAHQGGGNDQGPSRQNGVSGGRGGGRSPEPEAGGDDEEVAGSAADMAEEDSDPTRRREIRSKYRDLINLVQQNREDMLSPSNNKLTDVLEKANKLFAEVRQAREAALDAQLLVLATDLGKEKASQLHAEGSSFDPSAFAENLLTFMGLNRLEVEGDQAEGGVSGGYLPQDAWQRVANRAQCCFRTAPTFHYMLGSFLAELPPPRQRVERQRRVPSKEAKRIMPTQLKKMEESHQEATEKEVERILGYLSSYFADDPTVPISYYDFVIDPTSFSRSVENIFHTSFLVRDGLARVYLDSDKLPCIAPVEEGEVGTEGGSVRQQCVISINPQSWKEIIEVFEITESLIPTLSPNEDAGTSQESPQNTESLE